MFSILRRQRPTDDGTCRSSLAWAVGIALLLSALGQAPAETADPPFVVGVLYWSMNIPGQVVMREGLEAAAELINRRAAVEGGRPVHLLPSVAGDGEDGIERQIAQFEALVERRADLIIVQPTDNAALVRPLRKANEAGIPVVAYDQYISGGTLAAYLTSDNYQAGYLDGEYIASKFPATYAIKLILVEYPHVSSTVERVDGLLDALRDQQQRYTVLKTYTAVEPTSGRAAGEALLADFPAKGSVDVVFTVNDGGGLAVVEVLDAASRSEILVATIDGDPASVDRIEQGKLIQIDSAQFCGPLGAEAMRAGYRLLCGETVPRHVLVPVFPITRETRGAYRGWMGPIPESFEKPWPSKEPVWTNSLRIVKRSDED